MARWFPKGPSSKKFGMSSSKMALLVPTDGYSISQWKIGPLLEDMRNLLGWARSAIFT